MLRKYWGLIGAMGIAIAVVSYYRQQTKVTNSPTSTQSPILLAAPKNVWMTDFQQINGTPYLYAPIYVATEERKSILKQLKSGSYSDDRSEWGSIDIRNYMFVHRDNLSASKLLSSNNARLLSMEQIGELASPEKKGTEAIRSNWITKVITLWYVKVTADTNGDKVLDDRDRKHIAISDVSGANYAEVIKDIDKIILVYPKGINQRLVIYASGDKRFVADINLPKRQAIIKELPSIE